MTRALPKATYKNSSSIPAVQYSFWVSDLYALHHFCDECLPAFLVWGDEAAKPCIYPAVPFLREDVYSCRTEAAEAPGKLCQQFQVYPASLQPKISPNPGLLCIFQLKYIGASARCTGIEDPGKVQSDAASICLSLKGQGAFLGSPQRHTKNAKTHFKL